MCLTQPIVLDAVHRLYSQRPRARGVLNLTARSQDRTGLHGSVPLFMCDRVAGASIGLQLNSRKSQSMLSSQCWYLKLQRIRSPAVKCHLAREANNGVSGWPNQMRIGSDSSLQPFQPSYRANSVGTFVFGEPAHAHSHHRRISARCAHLCRDQREVLTGIAQGP